MKHLKKFENYWTTSNTGGFNINYGDNTELSEVVIDTIKYIEKHFDDIKIDLSEIKPDKITFTNGLKYQQIRLERDEEGIPLLNFQFYEYNVDQFYREEDITEADYNYLKDYFLKVYRIIRKKVQDRKEKEYARRLDKVEEDRMKKKADRFNI